MSIWRRRSGIQLAYPYEQKRMVKWGSAEVIVQPKLNGERCRTTVKNNAALLVSSECNPISSMPHIQNTLSCKELNGLELDGELYKHGMSFESISSRVSRTKNVHPEHTEVEYHIFDIVDMTMNQRERTLLLMNEVFPIIQKLHGSEHIKLVPSFICKSVAVLENILETYYNNGYEGIIVRNPEAMYVRKRTVDMLKWKPRKKDCYSIIGYEEVTDQYGRGLGMLGSVQCESDGQVFSVSCSSMPHEEKINWWAIREELVSQYAMVKYQTLTERKVPNHAIIVSISKGYEDTEDEVDYEG